METEDGVFENKHEMKRKVSEVVVLLTSVLLFEREGVNCPSPTQLISTETTQVSAILILV